MIHYYPLSIIFTLCTLLHYIILLTQSCLHNHIQYSTTIIQCKIFTWLSLKVSGQEVPHRADWLLHGHHVRGVILHAVFYTIIVSQIIPHSWTNTPALLFRAPLISYFIIYQSFVLACTLFYVHYFTKIYIYGTKY